MTWTVRLTYSRYVLYLEPRTLKVEREIQSTPEISTVTNSSVGILVADIHGSIHLLNREFESVNSWIAHVGGRVTHMAEKKGVLITLGVRVEMLGQAHKILIYQ